MGKKNDEKSGSFSMINEIEDQLREVFSKKKQEVERELEERIRREREEAQKRLEDLDKEMTCLLYTSPSPRDRTRSRMPSSA